MATKRRQTYEIHPDEPTSLEEQGLTPWELTAKEHWERFLPNLVRQLKAQGPYALDEAIRKKSHEVEYLTMLTVARTGLHPMQVEELFRDLLFPEPEPRRRLDTDASGM